MTTKTSTDGVAYSLGFDAFTSGLATTVEAARATNPFKGFGERIEHRRYVSWNKGWNDAKRLSEEAA